MLPALFSAWITTLDTLLCSHEPSPDGLRVFTVNPVSNLLDSYLWMYFVFREGKSEKMGECVSFFP